MTNNYPSPTSNEASHNPNTNRTFKSRLKVLYQYSFALTYIGVVTTGYILFCLYSIPKARASPRIWNGHIANAHITIVIAVASWVYTLMSNPGIITSDTLQEFDHYEYDELLYVPSSGESLRLPRSKIDRFVYKAQVIPRFDHYCGWVGNTIGEENYRVFLWFVCTQYFLCLYTALIIGSYFKGELQDYQLHSGMIVFDTETGKELEVTAWFLLQFLVVRNPFEAFLFGITGVISLLLTYFLIYHFRIASCNLTTNEDYKWKQVQSWHRRAKARYDRYQKKGTGKAKPLVILEGDVGCTGGQDPTESAIMPVEDDKESDADLDDDQVPDPGPMPKHFYDKGFQENWKEVFFPISIQRRKRASKTKAK